MKTSISYLLLILIVCVVCATAILMTDTTEALSKYGSRGDEVKQIQTKLGQWGYYDGNTDGIYGLRTVDAVKYFQRRNNLTPDGIAGGQTLAALGIMGNQGTSNSSHEADIDLLARVITGEARGEPYTGQVAVGAVILNRVKHPSFPNTIAGVVYQPGAFTAVNDGQINAPLTESCRRAAVDALNKWDPTYGCVYYYNPKTATNEWIKQRTVLASIGKHVFTK